MAPAVREVKGIDAHFDCGLHSHQRIVHGDLAIDDMLVELLRLFQDTVQRSPCRLSSRSRDTAFARVPSRFEG